MKYGGNKLQDIQKGKYIKIVETTISKENSLLVVKIGQKLMLWPLQVEK